MARGMILRRQRQANKIEIMRFKYFLKTKKYYVIYKILWHKTLFYITGTYDV
jgi:hypothetical protein